VPASPPERHLVRPGENLFRIALEYGLDYRQLARWNGITHPERIIAGTSLRLRPPAGSAVEEEAAEAEETPVIWVWPVRGKVIAEYDESAGRKGIQIAAPYGSPVLAAAAGRVVYAGHGLRGYGKLTIIRHGKALLSAYAHQSKILVKEGDRVAQGQQIGEVGDTDAERAKLHFEIRAYGRPVNPADYLPG
jgi:lipoprotein NlpD